MINMTDETYVGPRNGCGFLHRHECTGAACDGSKAVPNDGNPFEDTDDTRREDEPGDWFVADFDGECSRGGEMFKAASEATVRADGDGDFECQDCVMHDDMVNATVDGLCRVQRCRRGLCAQAATFWDLPEGLRGEFA